MTGINPPDGAFIRALDREMDFMRRDFRNEFRNDFRNDFRGRSVVFPVNVTNDVKEAAPMTSLRDPATGRFTSAPDERPLRAVICSVCGLRTGEFSRDIRHLVGRCCKDLPELWPLGGPNEEFLLAHDDEDAEEECDCQDCRHERGELSPIELEGLDRLSRDEYRERWG